jgi:hypothetical protein
LAARSKTRGALLPVGSASRRFRIKTVPSWMMARLRREFVALLQTQIMRLEHEIHIARQTGADYRDDDLASAETQVARAKEILNGTGGT